MSGLRQVLGRVLLGFILLAALIWTIFPLIWILLISLKTETEAFALPPALIFTPTFEHYEAVFWYNPQLMRDLQNSVVVALSATLLGLAIAVPAAYALSRSKLPRQESLAYGILWTSMIPLMGIAIPFFIIFSGSGLLATNIPLALAYTVIRLPLAVWLVRAFTLDLPRELEEAAYIDGCSWSKMMRKVLLPLLAPSLGAIFVINFVLCWNEFMLAAILTQPESATATMGVYMFMGRETVRWGPLAAYAVVVTVVPLIFVFGAQRYIVRGLTFGAVKG